MAMTMSGEVVLPADQQIVWQKLNDPEVLKACIPGCQSLERTGDNGFAAVAKIKVGPVSATFKGAVTLKGVLPSEQSKRAALRAAAGVKGVTKVNDKLFVVN